jgi:hypothetical protein
VAKVRPVGRTLPPYVLLPVFANDIGIPTPGQHAGFLGTGLDGIGEAEVIRVLGPASRATS